MGVHPSATIDPGAQVAEDARVWHGVHVRSGAKVGRRTVLGKDVYVDADVVVGDDCKVQNFATLYRGVIVGDRVFIGPHACFTNDAYPRAVSPDWEVVPTRVEDGASIGANATLLCGITIGRNAMVAAGAVVTKDVPPHALVMGVPARVVGWVCDCGRRLDETSYCSHCEKTVEVRAAKRTHARSRRKE